jgi:hypothetical protein
VARADGLLDSAGKGGNLSMSVVHTTKRNLFHNYPVDMLQAEVNEVEREFNTKPLTVEQARVNRRVYAALCEELAKRFGYEQEVIGAQQS